MENENSKNYFMNGISEKALKQLTEREHELIEYRQRILEQEKELDEYRTKLKKEQLTREKQLQRELESREQFYAEREKKQFERQREIEAQLQVRLEEVQQIRARLETEVAQREVQLHAMMQSLEQEKARYNEESRKKIEKKSSDYVIDALDTLKTKEDQFHFWSRFWGFSGATSLAIGVLFFIGITLYSFNNLPTNINWEFITFSLFKGLIAVTLFAALAKYSFLLLIF
jgi:hypothetical protein